MYGDLGKTKNVAGIRDARFRLGALGVLHVKSGGLKMRRGAKNAKRLMARIRAARAVYRFEVDLDKRKKFFSHVRRGGDILWTSQSYSSLRACTKTVKNFARKMGVEKFRYFLCGGEVSFKDL